VSAGIVLPALLAYAAALAPVSGLVPLGFVDLSDRYSCIPSACLWVLGAAGLQGVALASARADAAPAWRRVHRLCLLAAVALALGYAAVSLVYSRLWRDLETLARAACSREPANVFALGLLGDILLDTNQFEEALVTGGRLAAADRGWMTPAARRRALARGLYLQGFALFRLGQLDDSRRAFEAIAADLGTTVFHEPTNNTAIYAMMAEAYLQQGHPAKALACYDAILKRVTAGSFEQAFYRGVRELQAGDLPAARSHFLEAERLRPGNPLVRSHLERLGAARPADAAP
jgi:tetratricopeptide (TPR) repeat protein